MMKVLFAGTPDFAVPPLRALALEHDIVGVFTQPDRKSGRGKKLMPPPIKTVATELGLDIFQPSSLKDQIDVIAGTKPDVMVVVAYGMLLSQAILDIPKFGCINIHASILPRWRGAAPIHRAIEAGDRESGVAIMQMELGLDTGPVFNTLTTPILDTDTTATLHDKLSALGAEGICQTLRELHGNPDLSPTPQKDEQACYAKKISKDEAGIDWSRSAQEINQQVRAFIPYPVAQCQHNTTRLRIWQTSVMINHNHANAEPGEVIDIDGEGVTIQCGQNSLRLESLQRDGGKALAWSEFSHGYNIAVGDTVR